MTSVPGEASARLAGLFSGLLRLDVPLTPVPAAPYGVPSPAAAMTDDVSRTPVP